MGKAFFLGSPNADDSFCLLVWQVALACLFGICGIKQMGFYLIRWEVGRLQNLGALLQVSTRDAFCDILAHIESLLECAKDKTQPEGAIIN